MAKYNCTHLVERKKRFIYVTEKCGCSAKYIITSDCFTFDKTKAVCQRHFNVLTKWLNKIGGVYEFFELKDCDCEDKIQTGDNIKASNLCKVHNVIPYKED